MRILIVDDEPAVHESYELCFSGGDRALDAMAAELFGESAGEGMADMLFERQHCHQGLEAVAAVERARAEGAPFAVAFIDMRMPPGIDGRETARRIRALDPDVHLVIVTGYSDFSPAEIGKVAGPADKIFYIAKPFEVSEVRQMANALCRRWDNDRELAAARALLAEQVVTLEEKSAELEANESRAMHIAMHDTLTDAPNRAAFLRGLTERGRQGGLFVTAMLDLDRFKLVNDTLGHLAGDELIREVCATIQATAPMGAMVARLGGDEFGIFFDAEEIDFAVTSCDRIVTACASTFNVLGHAVRCGASCGLVMSQPGGERDPADLVRQADMALNEAKRSGRNTVRVFDASMDEGIRVRREIEAGLSQAIARDELSLAFQPIVGRGNLDIVGFEALVRWNTPERGAISPAIFIPRAEESHLIHELGDWILDHALAELQHWPGQYVSVNFSPIQFRRSHFVGNVMDSVRRAGVEPQRVQIEITETAIFDDAEHAAHTLCELRKLGFRIALDDFGTGYSSLYNIRKFALDCLKIDRSFIDGMGRERESAAIVHSIIHLGRALGLGVIAEGVETESQAQALRVAGASHLQGYLFSKPVPAAEARALAERKYMSLSGELAATPTLVAGMAG
ncbi:GGDEF domain-containing response regulator [Sphingomonas sanguinis]|uniref:GGDEF domain-containing response regulator n=1 Tax=Sphingomonas sanguinis TaxID=33051 RepID=UPI001C58A66D|nr:GGDEF domain-containing response regulator [Sphingomonas sanguinis]QXT36187.1 GGDEF domain-containing response regulator [Sphingomonas sanguinis]